MPHIELVHGSASKLPFSDASFERVASCMTFHEVRDAPDKTACLAEAMRLLAPGGRFLFVDLFDDPTFYRTLEHALEALRRAGGEIESARSLTEIFALRSPMNLGRVLGYAVVVSGTKSRA